MPDTDTIDRVKSRKVQVASLPPGDSGRGFARLPENLMKELGVAIDDLHAVAKAQQAKIQQPHNVHFTPEGYEVLANTVVAAIKPALATP